MAELTSVVREALQITGFVMVMMLLVDYLNVMAGGIGSSALLRNRWLQCLVGAALGAVPGCLGAFAVVSLYVEGVVGLGAVTACMIATAGDESFVMFAMVPSAALELHAGLFAIGAVSGMAIEGLSRRSSILRSPNCSGLAVHADSGDTGRLFDAGRILHQWRPCSMARGVLAAVLGLFLLAIILGEAGPPAWNWVRWTLLVSVLVSFAIVVTVAEHFLEEHLWNHVVRQHLPAVFLWTLGALVLIEFGISRLSLGGIGAEGQWVMLLVAALLGLIPESGPHLVFVTLFAKGLCPMSVLLTSSIVQDGHGMLPLLAHCRGAFVLVKLINLVVGIAVGGAVLLLGY